MSTCTNIEPYLNGIRDSDMHIRVAMAKKGDTMKASKTIIALRAQCHVYCCQYGGI